MTRLTAAEFLAMVTPKRRDQETPYHVAILDYLRLAYPGALIWHTANEIEMSGDEATRKGLKIAQAKAKKKGMLPGFPDIAMFHGGILYTFEVKAPDGRPTQEQLDVGALIEKNGGFFAVVTTVEEVKHWMQEWWV